MRRASSAREGLCYFNELLIDVNLVLSLVPNPFTAAMIASEIPAAIKPYSIAVVPDWSAQNFRTNAIMRILSAARKPAQDSFDQGWPSADCDLVKLIKEKLRPFLRCHIVSC
jgi:hypothetical protein